MKSFSLKSAPSRALQLFLGPVIFGLSVFAFSDIIFRFFLPIIPTSAITNTAESTVGPNTISMSNDNSVSISITPTDYQTTYRGVNELSITNSCPAGATITLTTTSNSTDEKSNNLVREGADNLTKVISPTTSTSLSSNSWGYSTNGSTFYAVPTKDKTPATIYNSSSATTSPATLNVTYGVKINNQIPAGNYTNDVIYTVAVKPACLEYTIGWDMNGGTMNSTATYPTSLAYDETLDLSTLTPTRDGYTFAGWINGSTGKAIDTSNSTVVNLNKDYARSLTIKAQWTPACGTGITCETLNMAANEKKDIAYSGTAKGFILNKAGRYKFEAWGASGGDTSSPAISASAKGGRGAYTSGTLTLTEPTTFYAYVGGAGSATPVGTATAVAGGWNGGGGTGGQNCCVRSYGSGGGSTDFRFLSGAWNDAISLRSRIMVAAGGGGSYSGQNDVNAGDTGGYGGKTSGGNGVQSGAATYCFGLGGTQTVGVKPTTSCNQWADDANASGFGYGGGDTGSAATGGGGGWYGGARSRHIASAGGGSSYISGSSGYIGVKSKTDTTAKCASGTSSLACSKSWTGYSFTSIKMLGGNQSMTAPGGSSETGHTGNGYARITYLGN